MSTANDNESIQKQVTAKRMVGAFGGNVASLVTTALAGLVMAKICLVFLGKADYGLVLLVSTVAGWTGLSDLGFGTAVRQKMTVLLARTDVEEAARVLSSGMVFYGIMAAIVAVAFVTLHATGVTAHFIKSDGVDVLRATRLLLLGFMLVLVTFPFIPLNGVLLSRNDFLAQNVATIISSLLRPAVTYVVFRAGGSVEAYLIAMSAFTLCVSLAKYGYVLYRAPGLRVRPSFASMGVVNSLVAPSISFFIISVAFTVIYGTGNVIISAIVGIAAVPAYAVTFQIFSNLRSLCVTSGDVLFPAAGILDSQGQHEKLQKYLDITTRMSMALAVLGGIGLLFLGGPFITLWYGPSLNPGYGTLLALGALLPVGTLVNMTTRSVCGVGRHHGQAVINVVEVVLNLALSITLAHKLGIVGVAVAILGVRVVMTPFYVADGVKQLKLDLKRLISAAVTPSVLLAAALFAIGTVIGVPEKMSWLVFGEWAGCYSVICAAILLAFLPKETRRRGINWFLRASGFAKAAGPGRAKDN